MALPRILYYYIGLSEDKDAESISKVLNEIAVQVVLTRADHPRAAQLDSDKLENAFAGKRIYQTRNIKEAMNTIQKITKANETVLVTGSMFLIGEGT